MTGHFTMPRQFDVIRHHPLNPRHKLASPLGNCRSFASRGARVTWLAIAAYTKLRPATGRAADLRRCRERLSNLSQLTPATRDGTLRTHRDTHRSARLQTSDTCRSRELGKGSQCPYRAVLSGFRRALSLFHGMWQFRRMVTSVPRWSEAVSASGQCCLVSTTQSAMVAVVPSARSGG
jgi:hypothetical protein